MGYGVTVPPLLRRNLRCFLRLLSLMGFDARLLIRNIRGLPAFIVDLKRYSGMNASNSKFRVTFRDMYPMLGEREAGAGTIDSHYFHQDLWAAKKIFSVHPQRHVDIGSRIDGFVAHVLVFMPVTLVDIRPVDSTLKGLTVIQDDATDLNTFEDNSVDSLSSLHAAEHFGLGRYSDPVDPSSCFRFMQSLQRVLCPLGRLYFSVPIGRERVEFNAHRVFAVKTILDTFRELRLVSFSLVGDNGDFYENLDPASAPDSEYACGLFEFTKPS